METPKELKFLPDIENLVFNGGGIRGICFIGALDCLENEGLNLKNVKRLAGTSVGALISFCYACGYSSKELLDEILNKNFKELTASSIFNLLNHKGLDKGEKIMSWLEYMAEKKGISPKITFEETEKLLGKKLYIVASNLNSYHSDVFSFEKTPKFSVLQAIRMSISVPFIFTPIKWNNCLYVDGGITEPFPLFFFEGEKEKTLGLQLQDIEGLKSEIKDITSFGYHVLRCLFTEAEKKHLQTIISKFPYIINISVDPSQFLNFAMTNNGKIEFYNIGYNSSKVFFDNYKTSSSK